MRNRIIGMLLLTAAITAGAGCGGDGGDDNPVAPRVPVLEQIVESEDFYGNPIFSPDEAWILYESDAAGNMDMYRIPAAGGAAEQLTFDPGFDSSGTWSDDGTQIAFESDRSGDKHIYVLFLDTPLAQPVALTDGSWQDGSPMFSPDGSLIVFESNREKSYGADLWTVPAGGGTLSRVTTTADGIYNRTADWSPDGLELVFESSRTGLSSLFTQPLAGGEAVQLTADESYEGHPSWSPDGSMITYESTATGSSEIYVVPAAGGQSLRLTTQGGYWPRFSPGGTQIVFGNYDGETGGIWVMDADF